MEAYFFDSSSLVKRYTKEQGTNFVIEIFKPSANNQIYVTRIALVEVISALTRKHRGNFMTAKQFKKAVARFRRVFKTRFYVIDIDEEIVEDASNLAEKYGLRGYDAIQLSTALEVEKIRSKVGASSLIFVSADNALNLVAQTENLPVENPNLYP